MGNQQGKTREDRFHWLGGIYDGEGSICMIQTSRTWKGFGEDRKRYYFDPAIKLSGTNIKGLNDITETLDKAGLPYHVSWREPKNKYLRSWMVEVKGVKRCFRWCQFLLDYVVWKKPEVELMLEFCHSRLQRGQNHTGYGSSAKWPPYTDREMEIIHLLRGRRQGSRLL